LKTGFICPSGFNLIATANINGRKVVGVVFGTRSGKARALKAKVVMENAATLPATLPIAKLQNEPGEPPNFRKRVCGGTGLKMVDADDFSGWGATFGKFKSAAEAEAVFNGIRAVRGNAMTDARGGVVRIPFTKDYVPVTFNMSRGNSQSLCEQVRTSGGGCSVVTPSVFASFANLAGRESSKRGRSGKRSSTAVRRKERVPRQSGK
jgi:D-alanyl-D-alanine carboxypeptidase